MRSYFYFTFFIKIYFYINIFLVERFIRKCTRQLQRMRNYDDELQHFDYPNPPDTSRWAYVDQTDILYDTDIDKSTGDIDHDDFDGDDDYFDN